MRTTIRFHSSFFFRHFPSRTVDGREEGICLFRLLIYEGEIEFPGCRKSLAIDTFSANDEDFFRAGYSCIFLGGRQGVALRSPECFYAIPSRWKAIYEDAAKNLKVIHAGIKLGTSKGKDIIPDQSLALSTELNTEAFPQIELSYEDAIRYLRKEAVNLPADTPKGYVLVTYQQMPLGWEKNIGNRANNLYPQEWKIKSSHVPEEPCVISKK